MPFENPLAIALFIIVPLLSLWMIYLLFARRRRRNKASAPGSEVLVFPERMELSPGGASWPLTRYVEIRNTNAKSRVHSVWIKISADPTALLKEIEIVDGSGKEFCSGGGSSTFSEEMVRVDAVDGRNIPCLYFITYTLEPLSSRYLKIRSSGKDQAAYLLFDVIAYSYEPAASSAEKSLLQIKPPEELQVKSISYLKQTAAS